MSVNCLKKKIYLNTVPSLQRPGYGMEDWEIVVRFLVGTRDFSIHWSVNTWHGPTLGTGAFSLEVICRRVRLKPDGTRRLMGGEVKGKLANGVGSQYSHTTSERGVSSITNADARTSAASSRLNLRPRRFKWTRPFRRKTKSGFCACAITFQTHSTWSWSFTSI